MQMQAIRLPDAADRVQYAQSHIQSGFLQRAYLQGSLLPDDDGIDDIDGTIDDRHRRP